MACKCMNLSSLKGNGVIDFEATLCELAVDSNRWKALYRCNECNSLWEESYTDGRWGGEPILTKVDIDYVTREWEERIFKL